MDVSYAEEHAVNPEGARQHLVQTYPATGSLSQTARFWHTSRQVVRKWVRRFQQGGALRDPSHRPHTSPSHASPAVEEKVLEARRKTGYGRIRLAWYLAQEEDFCLSFHTLRHILKRNGSTGPKRPRKTFYPAHWAWDEEYPFALVQEDTKDILDKATLSTQLWDHLRKHRLPRYQWTCREARTRLRFLAYGRELNITRGEEFGGSNPAKLAKLKEHYFQPLGARLARIPLGRKGYNGRVERSHRSDDEELYIPFLLYLRTSEDLLSKAAAWVYFYNLMRPHYGKGMDGKPLFTRLREPGYRLPEESALFPPILLDTISPDWATQDGNDLLAHRIALLNQR